MVRVRTAVEAGFSHTVLNGAFGVTLRIAHYKWSKPAGAHCAVLAEPRVVERTWTKPLLLLSEKSIQVVSHLVNVFDPHATIFPHGDGLECVPLETTFFWYVRVGRVERQSDFVTLGWAT